jgi:glycosyltransferase involved in cell wall biosynthesis
MRVLHCPTDTGGNPWGLSRAERGLGVESDVAIYRSSLYDYPADINFNFKKILSPKRERKRRSFLRYAIGEYDVFHYNFAQSLLDYPYFLLNHLELPVLKKAGKKIFFTFQGCDTRLRSHCRKNFSISSCRQCGVGNCLPDFIKKKRIQKISRFADKIYALNPDIIYNCPKAEFLPYASVDPKEWVPDSKEKKETKTLNILHFPTNRAIKGTKYIINAVNRLKKEGHSLEMTLVEKVPHSALKKVYQGKEIDVVVDQLLIGWYGAVAVEAMACGIPVVCYIRERDLGFIPQQMKEDLPIINAQPSTIYRVLKDITEKRSMLSTLSKRSRAYAEKWHDPVRIAGKVIKDYES